MKAFRTFKRQGFVIETYRGYKKMPHKVLAQAIGYKSGQMMSNIECGTCGLPAKKIEAICEVLRIDKSILIKAMVDDYRESITKEALDEHNKYAFLHTESETSNTDTSRTEERASGRYYHSI